MRNIRQVMEIIGIKRITIGLLLIMAIAYLLGRLFYVPPTYCYIDKIGYRTTDVCERYKMIDIVEKDSMQMMKMWYDDA